MLPLMPPHENRALSEIEQERPFVTYGWNPPLCPWCGQWLRDVDMRPLGLPIRAATACPAFHGMLAFNQRKWVDLRPPNVARGSDGCWYTSLTVEHLRGLACSF